MDSMLEWEFWDRIFYYNTYGQWCLALLFSLGVILLLWIFKVILLVRLKSLAEKTKTQLDDLVIDILDRTKIFFFIVVSVYAALIVLKLPPEIEDLVRKIVTIGVVIQCGVWLNRVVTYWFRQYLEKKGEGDESVLTALGIITFIGKVVVWSVVLLLTLDNLGINISALIAGLGVGGIAVALALQNVLGDLFASLSIILDKPFVVGDFIIVGDYLGNVERIGLKTTRIRSLSGEQLVFANNDLLGSRIRNYKRMFKRRVLFTLGVIYQTTHEQLSKIPSIIKTIIESKENAEFDRAHFKSYGDFALIYEVVYYVRRPEYNTYMDIQQAINLDIYREFEREGIEFAYPTQTLFIQKQEPVGS